MRLSIKQHITLFVSLICLSLVGIAIFIVFPTVQQIHGLQTVIGGTQHFLEIRYQSVSRIKSSVAALPDVEKAVAAYTGWTIDRGSELAFITQGEKLADTHHLDHHLTLTLEEPSTNTKTKRAQYRFHFTEIGNYFDVVSYLGELETLPPFIHIDKMVWEQQIQENRNPGTVSLTFDGIIYATR